MKYFGLRLKRRPDMVAVISPHKRECHIFGYNFIISFQNIESESEEVLCPRLWALASKEKAEKAIMQRSMAGLAYDNPMIYLPKHLQTKDGKFFENYNPFLRDFDREVEVYEITMEINGCEDKEQE